MARVMGEDGSKSLLALFPWPSLCSSLALNDGRSTTGLDAGGGNTGKYGWMKT